MPDFLQCTLGIRGVCHNDHAVVCDSFFRRDTRSDQAFCLIGTIGHPSAIPFRALNPLICKAILELGLSDAALSLRQP